MLTNYILIYSSAMWLLNPQCGTSRTLWHWLQAKWLAIAHWPFTSIPPRKRPCSVSSWLSQKPPCTLNSEQHQRALAQYHLEDQTLPTGRMDVSNGNKMVTQYFDVLILFLFRDCVTKTRTVLKKLPNHSYLYYIYYSYTILYRLYL